MSKNRNYCLTFFTEPKWDELSDLRYMIAGEEIAPTTGKIHWQAYIELNKPMRIAAVKKAVKDDTVHIEPRLGTRDQAREYCMKDGNYREIGVWIKGQGARTDLDPIITALKNGKKISEIMIEYPQVYCRYRNGLKDIAAQLLKEKAKEWRDVEVIVLSGPTGCGKTRRAMEENPFKIEGEQLQWWCGYDGEKTIVIDEYDNDVPITKMLNLLDGYVLKLPTKGSHTYALWKKVYITTNLRKHELHSKAKPAHRDALFRRITKWIDLWDDERDKVL